MYLLILTDKENNHTESECFKLHASRISRNEDYANKLEFKITRIHDQQKKFFVNVLTVFKVHGLKRTTSCLR